MKPIYTETQWQHRQRMEEWHRRTQAWLLFLTGVAVGIGFMTLIRIVFMW